MLPYRNRIFELNERIGKLEAKILEVYPDTSIESLTHTNAPSSYSETNNDTQISPKTSLVYKLGKKRGCSTEKGPNFQNEGSSWK